MAEKQKKYRVLNGISWYGDNRAEIGDIRNDIPKKSIPWLVEQGHIREYVEGEKWPEEPEETDGV